MRRLQMAGKVTGLRWGLVGGILLLTLVSAGGAARGARHGASLDGVLKYPANFAHFDYANPDAPKGGTVTLAAVGSFDTLNPFGLKGRPPLLLGGLLFETLAENSLDEPFSMYGLLAQSMEIAPDGLGVTFTLHPEARFADGKPVTAQDVVFSFRMLRSDAATPLYRFYYRDIAAVEALGQSTVRLKFAQQNKELPLIAAQLPVLPRHFYSGDFGRDFVDRALGSGPYRVERFDFGKTISYSRRKDYWAQNHPVNRGRNNFDRVVVKFYRDATVQLEALKAREFDFLPINSSKQWAVDVAGPKWENGWLVKKALPHGNNAGLQGFVFNTRRAIFQHRDVRHALALGLDFEWSNKTLFYGQYQAIHSYFSNSELAAVGLPTPEELALLEPLRGRVPPAVFTRPVAVLGEGLQGSRARLREAIRLLRGAGWRVKNGVLTETATGREMRFTMILVSPGFERIAEPYLNNLRRLGVRADMKVVDEAVYENLLKSHDFDMVVGSFGQSQSPGNEQMEFWHSRSADQEGSRNLIGIKNPAVDALVEALIAARNRRELITATRALDRVLWHEHYVVPHWFIDRHRITYWNKLAYPAKLPLYFNPLGFLPFWWVDAAAEQELELAIKGDRPFSPPR